MTGSPAPLATATRNTQPIHKGYPGLCTQHVDNSVEWLGRTGGEHVGNAGRTGNDAQHPIGHPRIKHTDCAQLWGNKLGK
jgi:hypothetical protein